MNEIAGQLPGALLTSEASHDGPHAKNSLGKDDFMKLLMTQLRYQDPLKPMDHEQFAAQLAQFGSLEQLSNIGTGIQGLKSGLGEGAKLQALGMIGKSVQASSDEITLGEGGATIPVPIPKDGLVPAKVTITDLGGNIVRELDVSSNNPGEAIEWNGKNQDGGPVPPGKYSFRVHGVGQDGQLREIGTGLSGRVVGVEMEGQTPTLVVETAAGKQRVDYSRVRSVSVDETERAPAMPTAGTAGMPGMPMMGATRQAVPARRIPIEMAAAASPETASEPAEIPPEGHGPDMVDLAMSRTFQR